MRKIERISVSESDRERLLRLVRDRNTPQKVVWRARIVLLAADGLQAIAIAAAAGKSLLTVRRWRRRYLAKGVDGLLKDATRPPRRKPLTAEKIKQVVDMTLHQKPSNATHWSLSSMAAATGLSRSSIQRIWSKHGLKPQPPVGEITEKTDEDSRSNRRPIELIDSPACQRSHISDRWTAE
jgi:transposase